MRLFIAIHPDPEMMDQLALGQKWLSEHGKSGRYPSKDMMHLTLAFLGEQPESSLPEMLEAMREAAEKAGQRPLPELGLSGAGYFKGRKGLLWFADLARNPSLMALQKDLTAGLNARGFPVEARRFLPHITIARDWSCGGDIPDRREPGSLMQGKTLGISGFSLMESRQKEGKLTYTELGYVKVISKP